MSATEPVEPVGYEARILSKSAQELIVFANEDYAQKICQCLRFMAITHTTSDVWEEVSKAFEPLRPFAASLILEARGGSVVATLGLSDFFAILDLGPRVQITNRFSGSQESKEPEPADFHQEIAALANKLGTSKGA